MISVSMETIGPEQAKELLEMNTDNFRKLDPSRVDNYSREMLSGNWTTNGDTIKVNSSSTLVDGQHRLAAIVKSGVTIETLVVRGIEDDGKTIDRGKPRIIAQWCSHKGISNATNVAATARNVLMYERGLWTHPSMHTRTIIDSDVFDFIEANQEAAMSCVRASQPVRPLVPVSLMAAVLFVGCDGRDPKKDPEAQWFVRALSKGDELTEQDAVFHLRSRLLSQTQHTRIGPAMKRALLTLAWNKTVSGEPCSNSGMRLRLAGPTKQKFPGTILKVASIELSEETNG